MNNAYIRAQQLKVKEAKFPFVKIGTQYWTTKNFNLSVTPQGNTIPGVQANENIERVVNGGFDTDTLWNKIGVWVISDGKASCNSGTIENAGNAYIFQSTTPLVVGKIYKAIFTITSITSGSVGFRMGGINSTFFGTAGTYTVYIAPSTTSNYGVFTNQNTIATIDNISVQEIGWAGSQELYDGIYAQTSGTVEQKTYAAVKAAAMWCNYNNDAPTGLIYGKLYNWFAVKLLQMDIDYYNAANPTKKWASGFRMPTQAEFQTLSTYLGGYSVGGGHLKEAGYAHWNSTNAGADNSSGFTALGGGLRLHTGSFDRLKTEEWFNTISAKDSTTSYQCWLSYNSSNITYGYNVNSIGFPLRLIKS